MNRTAAKRGAGSVDVLIIGAGHSGLAMSHCLAQRAIDHVILERGEVANSWKTERWDSLRLLTPNWQSRLPGYRYDGADPHGYMNMQEVIGFIQGYAAISQAPVMTGTTVTSVRQLDGGYQVETSRGQWRARAVVIASGAFNVPTVPQVCQGLPSSILQITPYDYRRAGQLPDGGVLVVGASATGLQLAEEIHASGRPVTLAVGEHVRLPRVYRGRDIQHWMHAAGVLDERYDRVDDIRRARGVPSPQLIGSEDRRTLDLNALSDRGVRLAGRLAGVRDGRLQFSGSLRNVCKLADLKMDRLLDTIDEWIAANGVSENANPVERFAPTRVSESPLLGLDLAGGEISTVLWATGFRPDYPWLHVPVLDRRGQIKHEGGVTESPGLVVMGLPYLRRRKSSFMHGAEDDARDLSQYLVQHLDTTSRSPLRLAV
jgi:putative flavoprotein involved in K+ transport